jgi:hypothetical protein
VNEMERILKNIFDPLQLLHEDEDPNSLSAKNYKKKQTKITLEYRRAYYAALNAGITDAELKQYGLYVQSLIDETTSAAGGGSVGGGVGGGFVPIPILVPNAPASNTVISPIDLAVGQAAIPEIDRFAAARNNNQPFNPANNLRFGKQKVIAKNELNRKAAKVLGGKESTYAKWDEATLRQMIADREKSNKDGVTQEEPEEKRYRGRDTSRVDPEVAELENKVAVVEQSIVQEGRGGNVHASVLKGIITAMSTSKNLKYFLLMWNPDPDKKPLKSREINSMLISIGQSMTTNTELLNKLLSILAKAGIILTHKKGMGSKEAGSKESGIKDSVMNQMAELSKNDPVAYRILQVAFTQAFRQAYESTRGYNPDYADRLSNATVSDLRGEQMEKRGNAADYFNYENAGLLETFLELLSASGYPDNSVALILTEISNNADEVEEGKGGVRSAYKSILSSILRYVDALSVQLSSSFVRGSGLRNVSNIGKLKRILSLMVSSVKTSLAKEKSNISKWTLVGIQDRLMKIGTLIGEVHSDFQTPTTSSGVKIDPSRPQPSNDREHARRVLEELNVRPNDTVSLTLIPSMPDSSRIQISTSRITIDWSMVEIDRIRDEIIQAATFGQHHSDGAIEQIIDRAEDPNTSLQELYQLADREITDWEQRKRILLSYEDAGDPDPDPGDEPMVIVGVGDRHRAIRVGKIAALISLIVGTIAGVDAIVKALKKNGKTTIKVPPNWRPPHPPAKPPVEPPTIGTGGGGTGGGGTGGGTGGGGTGGGTGGGDYGNENYYNSSNITIFQDPDYKMNPKYPEDRSGFTDPIYGGIGNIAGGRTFKPIGQPMLSPTLGSDPIIVDSNMMKSSSIIKLVDNYNEMSQNYNNLVGELGDATGANKEYIQKQVNQLSSDMNQVFGMINQQSAIVPEFGTNSYYGTKITPSTQDSLVFVNVQKPTRANPDGTSVVGITKVYPLISPDEYTRSVGLDDDIARYNNLAESYNKLANKYKGYGLASESGMVGDSASVSEIQKRTEERYGTPEFVADSNTAKSIENKIEPILAKINAVFENPSEALGRETARDVGYSELEQSLIKKVADGDFRKITPKEERALRDNPELYESYQTIKRLSENFENSPAVPISQRPGDKDYASWVRARQKFEKVKASGYKTFNTYDLPESREEYETIQESSQKSYIQTKTEFLNAVARLKNAKASGANSHQVGLLYNDLENKRLRYMDTRDVYEKDLNNYRDSMAGRSSYLADFTKEILPRSREEDTKFTRLQEIEKVLQNNPDALKRYNDRVDLISQRQNPLDIYQARMDVIKDLSNEYNLSEAYNDAANKDLSIHVPHTEEDPSTIVDFKPQSEPVGKSTERANFIDPAERSLFTFDDRDRAAEQKRWEDFSLVAPWNGLGNPRTNPLLDHQVLEYMKRYGNTTKGAVPSKADMRIKSRKEIIQRQQLTPQISDFPFIPTIQASFGKEIWEDEASGRGLQVGDRATFTRADNDLPDNRFKTWYPSNGTVYHPDRLIDMDNVDLSATNKLRTNSTRTAVFRYLPETMQKQYGDQMPMERFGGTMNNNFGQNPNFVQGVPVAPSYPIMKSLYDNMTQNDRRNMSMRKR